MGTLFLTKEQRQYNGEKSFQHMILEKHLPKKKKKINPDTDLMPFSKINPKWILDLNVHYKTI